MIIGMDPTGRHPTVAEIAAVERLHLSVVHPGPSLDREVEAPHTAELPHPGRWLNGGELVMTTGTMLGDDPEAWAVYVAELVGRGAVGLVLGLGSDAPYDSVPDFVRDLAVRHDLPLLTAPDETPFAAITRAVIAGRVESERVVLQESFTLQVKLTGIVARGGGIDDLAREWQASTGEGLIVLDRVLRVLGKNSGLDTDASAQIAEQVRHDPPELGSERRIEVDGDDIQITAFAGETTTRGYLARRDSGTTQARLSVSTLRSLLALEFERRWYLDEPERRRRAQAFNRLLALDDDARATALLKGVAVDGPRLWGVAVATASDTRAEVIVDDLAVVLGTPLLRQRDGVVECLTDSDPHRVLGEYALPEPVGVGTPVNPGSASLTLRQARAAMETSRKVGALITFVDGAAHDFLLHVADTAYLDSFADAVLGPIEATGNGAVLLETLHVWLAERRSLEACAVRMGVHRHTVRNRIHRITQVTGRDLDSVDAQTELWLALKARGFRDGNPTP